MDPGCSPSSPLQLQLCLLARSLMPWPGVFFYCHCFLRILVHQQANVVNCLNNYCAKVLKNSTFPIISSSFQPPPVAFTQSCRQDPQWPLSPALDLRAVNTALYWELTHKWWVKQSSYCGHLYRLLTCVLLRTIMPQFCPKWPSTVERYWGVFS